MVCLTAIGAIRLRAINVISRRLRERGTLVGRNAIWTAKTR
jgi:hypothetical protein